MIAIAGLLSSVFIVDEREKALVLQFGRVIDVKEEPGLAFKIPLIQEVVRYDDRILSRDIDPLEVTPLDDRRLVGDALARYRFSVVIENVREANYFSEKLVDAVLCNTVPIYWGCPNLERFVDTAGIIRCQSEADIREAVKRATKEEFERRLPRLKAIQPVLADYCDLERRAVLAVRDSQ